MRTRVAWIVLLLLCSCGEETHAIEVWQATYVDGELEVCEETRYELRRRLNREQAQRLTERRLGQSPSEHRSFRWLDQSCVAEFPNRPVVGTCRGSSSNVDFQSWLYARTALDPARQGCLSAGMIWSETPADN